MRPLVLVLCILFLFGTANTARAYWDDSVVIEIGGGLPPEPPPATPSEGDTGAGGGGSNTGSVGSGGSNPSTGSTGRPQAGSPPAGGSSESEGTNSGGGSSSADSGGSPGSASANDPSGLLNELFDLLVALGAIIGSGGSSIEGSANSSTNNAGTESGQSGTNNSTSAGDSANITVNAIQLRKTLRSNQNFEQILDDFSSSVKAGTYGRKLTARDVGLMAASTLLGNTDIQELSFGATKFELVYRSRGYLFGFIPKTFPVRVGVNPQATAAGERVTIALPWYRFFLRKLFTPSSLAREIDTVVAADVRGDKDSAADVQARLFEAVSLLLKQKIGTVGGSIQGV